MLERFICPDGVEVPIVDCLQQCRLKDSLPCGRCLSLRMLTAMAKQRPFNGVPTVTQLIAGLRAEFLKITKPYAADPQSLAMSRFGTNCHAALERDADPDRWLCEKRLTDPTGTFSGQFDCYDTRDHILYDTKAYGSFKIASVLGIKAVKEPVINQYTGEIERRSDGRVVRKTRFFEGLKDTREVTLQLNAYRLLLEANGFPVKDMRLELLVRDGGTWIAKSRGVEQNALMLRINRVSDVHIRRYLLTKARILIGSLEKNKPPEPCKKAERWDGLKCKSYCPVKQWCKELT